MLPRLLSKNCLAFMVWLRRAVGFCSCNALEQLSEEAGESVSKPAKLPNKKPINWGGQVKH